MKKLKLTITWDNGKVTNFGKVDYETFIAIRTLADELFEGNAVDLSVDGGLWTSFPEKHSGKFLLAGDVAKLADTSKHSRRAR